ELEAEKVRLNTELRRNRASLESFRVHPEYEAIERDANHLTRQMQQQQNETTSENELLHMYENSLRDEIDAEPDQVAELYAEAGVTLGEAVRKRLDEVQAF